MYMYVHCTYTYSVHVHVSVIPFLHSPHPSLLPGLQDTIVFDVWFKVDARPFKQALLNIIKRWSFMFKEHLISHVTTSLNDLEEFIRVTSTGFNVQVEEGDYNGLVGVMGHLLAVKDRQTNTGIHY